MWVWAYHSYVCRSQKTTSRYWAWQQGHLFMRSAILQALICFLKQSLILPGWVPHSLLYPLLYKKRIWKVFILSFCEGVPKLFEPSPVIRVFAICGVIPQTTLEFMLTRQLRVGL